MKRQDISRLEKNRTIYFKVGLAISLTIALLAINWTTAHYESDDMPFDSLNDEPEIEVVRTIQQPARPMPPPPVHLSNEIIAEETPEFAAEPFQLTIEESVDGLARSEDISRPATSPESPNPAPLIVFKQEDNQSDIFKIVEEMPRFGDCASAPSKDERELCSDRAVLRYFAENIRYPDFARTNNIEGLVVVQFIIEKDGSVTEAHVIRDIGGNCGKEALRVANNMPKWTPGLQRGRPVRVQINMPVRFQLK